jgi:hypothetical protein
MAFFVSYYRPAKCRWSHSAQEFFQADNRPLGPGSSFTCDRHLLRFLEIVTDRQCNLYLKRRKSFHFLLSALPWPNERRTEDVVHPFTNRWRCFRKLEIPESINDLMKKKRRKVHRFVTFCVVRDIKVKTGISSDVSPQMALANAKKFQKEQSPSLVVMTGRLKGRFTPFWVLSGNCSNFRWLERGENGSGVGVNWPSVTKASTA